MSAAPRALLSSQAGGNTPVCDGFFSFLFLGAADVLSTGGMSIILGPSLALHRGSFSWKKLQSAFNWEEKHLMDVHANARARMFTVQSLQKI